MTEVDVSIPESSTLSTTNNVTTITTSCTTENINNNVNNMSPSSKMINSQRQNGPIMNDKCDTNMEIDRNVDKNTERDGLMDTEEDDYEEDDSRITSSTGGRGADVGGEIGSTNIDDNSKSELITTTKSITNLNENSSNACDGSEKLNTHIFDRTVDKIKADEDNTESSSVSNEKVHNVTGNTNVNPNINTNNSCNSNSNSSHTTNKIQCRPNVEHSEHNDDGDDEEDDDNDNDDDEGETKAQSLVKSENNNHDRPSSKNDITPVDDSSNDSKHATPVNDPLAVNSRKENGSTINVTTNLGPNNKSFSDTIVDLGDDSDVEIAETPERNKSKIFADSEGAVIIGSDSDECDNENFQKQKQHTNTINSTVAATNQTNSSSHIIDDDDDDCVVIEDDGLSTSFDDLSKRKIGVIDSSNLLDDNQPPIKRLRTTQNVNMMQQQQPQQQQFAIKDARSLMSNITDASLKRNNDVGIYPVNISPASSNFSGTGPPKLVPVSNTMLQSPIGLGLTPLVGLPNMAANATLLPGLTDDMFVLEAPSFIVPYIYEKPPTENIKEVIKELEAKFAFSKEDLAEVDKTDEFDMTTEQNKEDRDEKNAKKNRKRRRNDDADDSWSEESEDDDDDDDDDSESGMRTKVLIKEASDDIAILKGVIKPASLVAQSGAQSPCTTKPGQENYFESPLGKFFMDIGVGLVQEFVQSDLIRLQKRKMRKSLGRNVTHFEVAIAALTSNLEASKKKNVPFKFNMKRCEFCNFKSESALAMAHHYETPHTNGALYKCNFCIFEVQQRNTTEIVYHMEAVHNIKARLIKPLPYHQCPNCGFEDNGKAKLARHQPVCAKKFRPDLNLAPPGDWEAPAKIPRIKPRHGLVGTATAYQAMAAQQKAALASIQQQQQARNMQAAALAAQTAVNKMRGRSPQLQTKPAGPVAAAAAAAAMIRHPNQMRNPAATNVVLPNNYQVGPSGLLMPQTMNKKLLNQPSISITPLPRQNATPMPTGNLPSTSKMPQNNMKPGQTVGGKDAKFVICEICDGYIKDLESLRNHMQWIHKVKIHPKMIYNRPPLNCQKCQFRFFTDQGLERHLLGSHGLVTSSMQEAANKGKDAGRCPVCGRVYQWKLLNHVSRDHHMTLKPAHLSYKCTVCTATFGMYKQFETHVYTAHSTVAKKAMDGKKNSPVTLNAQSSTSSNIGIGGNAPTQRSGVMNTTSDSLLKPLKINDEITIIPQPASKSRLTNIDTHVID